jgi:hypothetical protein
LTDLIVDRVEFEQLPRDRVEPQIRRVTLAPNLDFPSFIARRRSLRCFPEKALISTVELGTFPQLGFKSSCVGVIIRLI